MSENINGIMGKTMDRIKEMVDVNTVVGDPIVSPDGTMIIPVSKVTCGFGAGGSDFSDKTNVNKSGFGGGSGAGITIQPIAFLTVYKGNVKLLQINKYDGAADRVVGMMPEIIDKVSDLFKKDNKCATVNDLDKESADETPLF